MSTIAEAQHILRSLALKDREAIARWLDAYQEEPAVKYTEELPYMTVEEYLKFEESSPTRHEYVNGYVHAMNGASMAHGLVANYLFQAISKRLGDGPCQIFTAGLKLMVDTVSEKEYLYPDLMVSCDRAGWRDMWLHNPRFIVEVLSPSTQHIDRREKAATYRRMPSVEEYVIAAQSSWHLTILRRAENWVPEVVSGRDGVAEFRSLGVAVPLAEIYRRPFSESVADGSGPE